MADKLTLLELHLHSEDNEFTSDVQFSSDIGSLLRRCFGLGSGDSETDDGMEAVGTADDSGVQTTDDDSEDEDADGAVIEIDEDDTDESDDEDDGDDASGSTIRKLFVLMVLVALALVVRWYLGGDDLDDEFAGGDNDSDEFEEL